MSSSPFRKMEYKSFTLLSYFHDASRMNVEKNEASQ